MVAVKGNGDMCNLATWSANGYSYSISAINGMTLEEMTELVEEVK